MSETIENVDRTQPQIMYKFQTPILKQFVPDFENLNKELKALIFKKEQASLERLEVSRHRSNIKGWRSEDDVLKWNEPSLDKLQGHVVKAVLSMVSEGAQSQAPKVGSAQLKAFINVNREGSYNTMHSHHGYHWAAVYYVEGGKPDPDCPESGLLEFQDPRGAAHVSPFPGFDFGKAVLFQPESGLLTVFPAWLNHCVHPYFGEDARISIAFNIRLSA